MLVEASLLDAEAKKWLEGRKKETKEHREYERGGERMWQQRKQNDSGRGRASDTDVVRPVIHHMGQLWLGIEFYFGLSWLLNYDLFFFVTLLNC